MFQSIYNFFSEDIAIDLGTANTLVYVRGRGIVIDEPSVVAFENTPRGETRVYAIGRKAKEMLGKTHMGIHIVRPLKDGVIADFEAVSVMIKYFIKQIHRSVHILRPRIIICVPYGVTEVERRAVREAAKSAGAREVFLIEEPMAAAIGCDLPIHEAVGNMIVDIGGGTTEIAVISLYGIVLSNSIRVGGDKMDEAIVNFVKRNKNLLIGDRTAERIKVEIGNAIQEEAVKRIQVKGNDLVAGIPRTLEVDSNEISHALEPTVSSIVEGIRITLEKTPPELAGDILENGVFLAGGGCQLRNLEKVISKEVKIPVQVCENPFLAVAIGSGRVLSDETLLRKVTMR